MAVCEAMLANLLPREDGAQAVKPGDVVVLQREQSRPAGRARRHRCYGTYARAGALRVRADSVSAFSRFSWSSR